MSSLLQLTPIGPLADALLAEMGAVRLWQEDAGWLARHGADVELLATSVRRGCDAAMLSALPMLRAISSWGAGYDTLDVAGARARGIAVANTPDVLDDCVADLAWGLLIAASRRIPAANRYVQAGEWRQLGQFPITTKVSGRRLGILGLGRIGSAVARRGEGFSMDIRYTGRSPRDVGYVFEPSLLALAEWADFLVVACGGDAETFHLVDAAVLCALGKSGILINVGRGSVVDQSALVEALEAGELGGAGLDVLEGEPGAPEALARRDNVVITPHVGSATVQTRQAMEQLTVDNLKAFLQDGRLLTPVKS
ncbi:2-hydroxyacid dehydrogenase [Roseomonas xinghualingensis]|uniref:2-hydroxyacid dehydrogenase n=1 Tax=Roseomonas xinghualingensis TaxID=2986475 RepID=UPI0021F160D8|nr:2-hydroxyacid dehydrogenase [Roseomonas sp. SXEYE001]MCV4209803.1 2-hydroxyacid dehydrogenase [Roseomonas sp. SXEYE001]